jgi:hypothetical protein
MAGRGATRARSHFFPQEDLQADFTKRGDRRLPWINWSNAPKRASFRARAEINQQEAMPLRRSPPCPPVAMHFRETEMAVGHDACRGARQAPGPAVVTFSALGTARRGNVTGEAESVGLAGPSPKPPRKRRGLLSVAGSRVDPPGREASPPRAQKKESCCPEVNLVTVELLDSARDQRGGLLSAAHVDR